LPRPGDGSFTARQIHRISRHQHVLPQALHRYLPQPQRVRHPIRPAPRDSSRRIGRSDDDRRDDRVHLVHELPVEEAAEQDAAALNQRSHDVSFRQLPQKFFEVDVLIDTDTDDVYLGELNPRISGASSMTNVTAGAYADVPLFLFHLLEFMDVDYEIDVDELNERWTNPASIDAWSQFVMKQSEDVVELITAAPASGRWHLDPGGVRFVRPDVDWHTIGDRDEAFYLRIAGAGHYRYKGADLGILVTRGRLMDDDYELTDRARAWISGIKAAFRGVPVEEERPPSLPVPEPFGFKML